MVIKSDHLYLVGTYETIRSPRSKTMSDQHTEPEIEDVCSQGEVNPALSTNDGAHRVVLPETSPRLCDVLSENDTTKLEGGESTSHPPTCLGEDEQHPSEEERGVEVMATENPQLHEEEVVSFDQSAPSVEERSLRYANPFGTFITGFDVGSEVRRVGYC